MIWSQNVNPRVWQSAGYVAFATEIPYGEQGYVGQIYRDGFPMVAIPGTQKWGRTVKAALKVAVKAFDPEATLPKERQPLTLGSREAENTRVLDRKMRIWLHKRHYCPLCYADQEEEIPGILITEPSCRLCNGSGEVTGAEIEAWASETRQPGLLPDWWPSP